MDGINIEDIPEVLATAQRLDYDRIADALAAAAERTRMAAEAQATAARLWDEERGGRDVARSYRRNMEDLVAEAAEICAAANDVKRLRQLVGA